MTTKTLMNSGGTCQLITGKQEHGVTGHSLSPALPAVPGSQKTEQEESGAEGLLGIALSVSWEHGRGGSLSVVTVAMLGVFTAPYSCLGPNRKSRDLKSGFLRARFVPMLSLSGRGHSVCGTEEGNAPGLAVKCQSGGFQEQGQLPTDTQ